MDLSCHSRAFDNVYLSLLVQVQEHANEYHAHVENLEMAKQEVEKEFAELHAKKQELQIWRREAEETLQNRIDSFVKGKEELTSQIQELVNQLLPLPISSLISPLFLALLYQRRRAVIFLCFLGD